MKPIEFKGKQNPDSFHPYIIAAVALLGSVAGVAGSFPAFAVGWALVWGGLAYLIHRRQAKDVQFFKIRLDDLGIRIEDRHGSCAMQWDEIESVEWTGMGVQEGPELVFNFRAQKYVYQPSLNDADFADFIQALKLKMPNKAGNLPRRYYSTYIHGRVVAAREMRRLRQPEKAEQCYREAIQAGANAGRTLGLGMLPVFEQYSTFLARQGRHEEVQVLTDRIAVLVSRVVPSN